MNKKTKVMAVGLTALLVIGLVGIVNAIDDGQKQGRRGLFAKGDMFGKDMADKKAGMLEDLGLSGDATREEIKDAMWDKKLAYFGLTEENTLREFMAARKAKAEERHSEMLSELGLSDDATCEETRAARKTLCEENPNECPRKRMGGFGRGGGMSGFGI